MDGKVVSLSLVPSDGVCAARMALAYMREALKLLDDDGGFAIVGARLSDCIDHLEQLTARST